MDFIVKIPVDALSQIQSLEIVDSATDNGMEGLNHVYSVSTNKSIPPAILLRKIWQVVGTAPDEVTRV